MSDDVAYLHIESVIVDDLIQKGELALRNRDLVAAEERFLEALVMAKGFPVPPLPGQKHSRDELVAICQAAVASPLFGQGEVDEALKYSRQALAYFRAASPLTETEAIRRHCQAQMNEANGLLGKRDTAGAATALERAKSIIETQPEVAAYKPYLAELQRRLDAALDSR